MTEQSLLTAGFPYPRKEIHALAALVTILEGRAPRLVVRKAIRERAAAEALDRMGALMRGPSNDGHPHQTEAVE